MKLKRAMAILLMGVLMISQNMISVLAEEERTYIIIDVFDHYTDECATIQEIQLYDKNGNLVDYNICEDDKTYGYNSYHGYESILYWSEPEWGSSHLNDGNLEYGLGNSCALLCFDSPGDENWARFVIDVDKNVEVASYVLTAGYTRIPKEVSFYKTDAYDVATNIIQRDNTGLTLIGSVKPEEGSDNKAYTINDSSVPAGSGQALDLVSTKYDYILGNDIVAEIELNNAPLIYAEQFTIAYDNTMLDYIDAQPKDGDKMKIYNIDTSVEGKISFIVASTGAENGIDGSGNLIDVTFKAKKVGETVVSVGEGKTADGYGNEYDVLGTNKTYTISPADVNNDGIFSLADLGIAGRLFSTTAELWDTFTPDVDMDTDVDFIDLESIVASILAQ